MEHKRQAFGDCKRDEDEKIGVQRFIGIAERYRGIFAHTGQTGAGAFFDILAEDRTGGTIAVENKVRDIAHDRWATTFIEPSKLENEIQLWRTWGIPTAYINYFSDGVTLIWDIARIAELKYHEGFRQRMIDNIEWTSADGEKYYKSENRILLPNSLAIKLDAGLEVTNRKEYMETVYGLVRIERKPHVIGFDKLDKINDLLIWTKNQ